MMTIHWRRIMLTYGILLMTGWSCMVNGQTKPHDVLEKLDARQWNFSNRLPLKGQWSFIENKLVSPDHVSKENWSYTTFPSLWNERRADGKGFGCATYALNVILPDTSAPLALEIPQLYSSYKIWIDGNLVGSVGDVGCEAGDVSPQWVYHMVPIPTSKAEDTLQVVLQVSNYHHYKGGSINPIYLGSHNSIREHFNWSIGSSVFEASVLFLEGVFFLFFYWRSRKTIVLYFALLCITWALRSVFSNVYPIMQVVPDFPWIWLVKIEYFTLYFTVIWAALFFDALFKGLGNRIFTYLPVALNLFFTAFTLLTPAVVFTRWVSVYLFVAAMVILYGVVLIVRALINDQKGSWFLMSSIWVGVLIFGYDIAAYQSSFSYNIVFLNIGYVAIFILTTIALLYHLGIFKNEQVEKNVLTLKDLYGQDRR